MKLKNIELLHINNTLNKFADKKLPQRISFAITKNLMIIGDDMQCYYKEVEKLMKKYNAYFEKDENGEVKLNQNGIPCVHDSQKDNFFSELNELLNISIDISFYNIDEGAFDYDDISGKFDPMSAKEIVELQSIICNRK